MAVMGILLAEENSFFDGRNQRSLVAPNRYRWAAKDGLPESERVWQRYSI
jgi:hypothetical protein